MLRPALRILVALLCLARAADAAPTVFHDEIFADADWTLQSRPEPARERQYPVTFGFRSGGGAMAGGSVTAAQERCSRRRRCGPTSRSRRRRRPASFV
jgi:hypothetical protein